MLFLMLKVYAKKICMHCIVKGVGVGEASKAGQVASRAGGEEGEEATFFA